MRENIPLPIATKIYTYNTPVSLGSTLTISISTLKNLPFIIDDLEYVCLHPILLFVQLFRPDLTFGRSWRISTVLFNIISMFNYFHHTPLDNNHI